MMLVRDHPEAMDHEVCVMSCVESDFENVGWKTKRMGVDAYSLYGTPLGGGLRPVFVHKEELRL